MLAKNVSFSSSENSIGDMTVSSSLNGNGTGSVIHGGYVVSNGDDDARDEEVGVGND